MDFTQAATTNLIDVPTSGRVTLVHKKDHEGVLQIDPLSGWIITPLDERPEWAEGLVSAQTGERHIFYASRLGDKYTEDMKMPEAMAFEDLGWMGLIEHDADHPYINPETGAEEPFELTVLDADHEFRSEIIAQVNGFTSKDDVWDFGDTEASVDIAYPDQERTAEEVKAFEDSQRDQLKAVNE